MLRELQNSLIFPGKAALQFPLRALFLIFVLVSCSSDPCRTSPLRQWMQADGKIKVLSTTAMIDDLVREVGGDEVDTIILIKGDLDPHSYQLVKGDDEKLARADILFANGLNLEHGPSLQRSLRDNPKAVMLGDLLMKSRPDKILKLKGDTDPHIWMDISIWSLNVPLISEALSRLRPEKSAYFQERGQKLIEELTQAHTEVLQIVHEVPAEKRYLVTSHDAFSYFARAYLAEPDEILNDQWRDRFQAPEGLAPESQISQQDIKEIIDHLKTYNIQVVFPESNVSRDCLQKIVQAGNEKGLQVRLGNPYLYGDSMGPCGSDGDTYLKMIKHNAKTIREDL